MIETLNNLTDRERMAIMRLAAQVITASTDGHLRTDDTDFVTVSNSLLEYPEFEMASILQGCINMRQEEVKEILSNLSDKEKRVVQFMISGICHDDARRTITAAMMMRSAGFMAVERQEPRQMEDRDYGIEEEDERTPIKDAWVRLLDTSKILFDQVETFRFLVGENPEPVIVESGYDDWLQKKWCPSNGMVGIICKTCRHGDEEICFVNFSNKIVVPVLKSGLENIENYEWKAKTLNNFVLAHDRDGERSRRLRNGIFERPAARTERKTRRNHITYVAHKQDRFEPGMTYPTSFVERIITFDYNDRGDEVDINIRGVMQPKHAKLYQDTGTVLKYRDTTNPGYTYEIETEPVSNEIVRFSLFVAFTGVEYRYTN